MRTLVKNTNVGEESALVMAVNIKKYVEEANHGKNFIRYFRSLEGDSTVAVNDLVLNNCTQSPLLVFFTNNVQGWLNENASRIFSSKKHCKLLIAGRNMCAHVGEQHQRGRGECYPLL